MSGTQGKLAERYRHLGRQQRLIEDEPAQASPMLYQTRLTEDELARLKGGEKLDQILVERGDYPVELKARVTALLEATVKSAQPVPAVPKPHLTVHGITHEQWQMEIGETRLDLMRKYKLNAVAFKHVQEAFGPILLAKDVFYGTLDKKQAPAPDAIQGGDDAPEIPEVTPPPVDQDAKFQLVITVTDHDLVGRLVADLVAKEVGLTIRVRRVK